MGVKQSFNRITVDGDTSTNDAVLVMASCESSNPEIDALDTEDSKIFAAALADLLKDLALLLRTGPFEGFCPAIS